MHDRHPSRWRARIAFALLCLLIGAFTNIAVSWYVATRGDLHNLAGQYTRPAVASDIPRSLRDQWPASGTARITTSRQWGHEILGADCEFAGNPGDGEGRRICTLWHTRFGWPFIALEHLEVSTFGGNEESKKIQAAFSVRFPNGASLQVPPALARYATSGSTFLPAHPVFPGFLLNTLLYATLAGTLIQAPFILRRRARIKSGLCPTCGYALAQLPLCPECGTPRT